MGIFDASYDPNNPYGNPNAAALAAAAGAFGQGAMPTRVPVPFGAILGQAGNAAFQGAQEAQKYQASDISNQTNRLQLEFLKRLLPAKADMIQQAMGGEQAPALPAMPGAGGVQAQGGDAAGGQALPHPLAIMMAESRGDLNVKPGDGGAAIGPMQLHEAAAQDVGMTPEQRNDPVQNLIGGQKYLAKQQEAFKDTPNPALWATVAYNQGPGFAKKWDGQLSSLPPGAATYVHKVNSYMGGKLLGSGNFVAGGNQLSPTNQQVQNDPTKPQYDALIQKASQLAWVNPDAAKIAQQQAEQTPYYQNMTATIKAKAEASTASEKAEAEKTAVNLTDAQKTFNVAAGSLPRAIERFEEIRKAAGDATSGTNFWAQEANGEEHEGYGRQFARSGIGKFFEPKTAAANQIIGQATKQGILAELGPQLAGLRGNKFLESIASGASGLNVADPPEEKIKAVNGLEEQYVGNMKSLAAQRRSYGDKNVPTDAEIDAMVAKEKARVGGGAGGGAATHKYIPGKGIQPMGGQ